MYLHLGQSVVIPDSDILGIFDLDNASWAYKTRELLERAETLAGLLLAGDELACAQALVELELSKPKAEELSALLLETERAVSRRLAREPRRGARVLQALKTARENAVYRPGTGHTLGQIITRIF